MSKFGIAEAQLIALFMESAAWGVQIVTFTICIYTLVGTSRKLKRQVNASLVTYAVVLFGLGTLDIAFAVYRNLQAFVYYEGEGGAATIFNQLSDYVTVLRNVWKLLAILVADSALIYRCWVIYGRKMAYIIPSTLLWMACFATAAVDTYYTSTLKEATGVTGAKKVEHFFNVFLVCEVVLNIITTAMILYRIHNIYQASARYFSNGSGSMTVLGSRLQWPEFSRILIESAMIYTLINIIVLAVNFAHNNAVYPVSDIDLQVAGIQFDLILIRLGRNISAEHLEAQTKSATMQIHLRNRNFDPHLGQQPVIAVSVSHDTATTMSHELRMVHSDTTFKTDGTDDGAKTVKITGIGEDCA